MESVAIFILISCIYILFDILIWKGLFYQMTISRIPHSDFYACRKMLFNLHKNGTCGRKSGSHVYHIKGSKLYMVVFGDDLYELYYANNLKELDSSYSVGGVGLESTWNSLIKHKIGQILYVWHTTKGKTKKRIINQKNEL